MVRIIEYIANMIPLGWLLRIVDIFTSSYPRIQIYDFVFTYALATNLKGDYLEFGVYRGKTFSLAYHHAMMRGITDIKFYAFDSFEGLPESAEDYGLPSNMLHGGQFYCSVDEFKKRIVSKGVDVKKVCVTKGWFKDVLCPELKEILGLERAAVVMIDCDLYEAAVPVLRFITNLVDDGSVIMLDDWFLYNGSPRNGVQRATYEWLEANPDIELIEYHKFGWHGNSFIVSKR